MALFRRKKESVLPEVDKYYEAERRDRTGLAWLLALVSILVVAALIIGLFFAGRWAYNSITDNDEVSQGEGSDAADLPTFDGGPDTNNGDESVDPTPPAGDTAEPATPPADSEDDEAPVTESRPLAGTGVDELPNTGAGSLIGIFAGVSTVAGGTHYLVQRHRDNKS